MTPVPDADDLRELDGASLTDPHFPRWRDDRTSPPPPPRDPAARFARSRYRLFRRVFGAADRWVCVCGREACRTGARTWAQLRAAHPLWMVPPELVDRTLEVLRRTSVHYASAPVSAATAGPVVSSYSDLSRAQREALLAGRPGEVRRLAAPTGAALARLGLLRESYTRPGSGWYLLTPAGLRARAALEAGEVPDPPGTPTRRTWTAEDPEPAEDGLEVADRDGDVWRRRGGRWDLVEFRGARIPREDRPEEAPWSEVRQYAPLTERPRRDQKAGRPDPLDVLRVPLAAIEGAVRGFLYGEGSLTDLRRARLAAHRALDASRRMPR